VMVEYVEFLVEEPSTEAALRTLLPALLGDVRFEVFEHRSKGELLKRLPGRLAGYSKRRAGDEWFRKHARVVIVVDRDDDDCRKLKRRIEQMVGRAGIPLAGTARPIIIRIAVEELEAWYFGDWAAVRAAYPRVSAGVCRQARYRDPDAIPGGTWEAFERVMQRAGYFVGGLRKIEAAREISAHMVPAVNTSRSFQVLRDAVAALATASAPSH
jgi:hypothetical protein